MKHEDQNPPVFDVPNSFWSVIESAKPELQRLIEWLEAANREQIISFARAYDGASKAICEYWDGPTVDGVTFSEDDTEDFCNWVVSQGRTLWSRATATLDLEPFVRMYWASEYESDPAWPKWRTRVVNPNYRGYEAPGSIAYAVFETRFAKNLGQHLEESV